MGTGSGVEMPVDLPPVAVPPLVAPPVVPLVDTPLVVVLLLVVPPFTSGGRRVWVCKVHAVAMVTIPARVTLSTMRLLPVEIICRTSASGRCQDQPNHRSER